MNNKYKRLVSHIIILVIGLTMLYPLFWMLSSSFKNNTEIFQSGSFLPNKITFINYIEGWKAVSGETFGRFFLNSLFLACMNIIGNVCACLLAAYAFAKLDFPFKKVFFAIMLMTLMLPIHVRLIPQYIVFNKLHWINTYIPLILPKFLATEGFFVFLMVQFIRGIPKELDEAATIDGCGPFRTFFFIIAPLTVPAIVTTSIFTFIWTWNDFFSQLIYISKVQLYTVSVALRMFVDSMGNSSWGGLFAMSILSLIPLFVIFVVFQKYLIEGITAGSVKG